MTQTFIACDGKLVIKFVSELPNAYVVTLNGESRSVSKYPHPHVSTAEDVKQSIQTAIDFLHSQGYGIVEPVNPPIEDEDVKLVNDIELLGDDSDDEPPFPQHPWDNSGQWS